MNLRQEVEEIGDSIVLLYRKMETSVGYLGGSEQNLRLLDVAKEVVRGVWQAREMRCSTCKTMNLMEEQALAEGEMSSANGSAGVPART